MKSAVQDRGPQNVRCRSNIISSGTLEDVVTERCYILVVAGIIETGAVIAKRSKDIVYETGATALFGFTAESSERIVVGLKNGIVAQEECSSAIKVSAFTGIGNECTIVGTDMTVRELNAASPASVGGSEKNNPEKRIHPIIMARLGFLPCCLNVQRAQRNR